MPKLKTNRGAAKRLSPVCERAVEGYDIIHQNSQRMCVAHHAVSDKENHNTLGEPMALFIEVEVAPAVAADAATVKQLVEVCPVNIFARADSGTLQIVEKNLDECTLCELCLNAAPPGTVKVKKLYGERDVLVRKTQLLPE